MNLVPINSESVPLGQPLPFALRSANGALLAQKGFVVSDAKALNDITGMGIQLCVDVDESGDSYRAYVGRLQQMLMAETSLGELASVKMSAPAPAPAPARNREERGPLDWSELQLRVTQVLRAPKAVDFRERLQALHEDLARRCEQAPDATLLALISCRPRKPACTAAPTPCWSAAFAWWWPAKCCGGRPPRCAASALRA